MNRLFGRTRVARKPSRAGFVLLAGALWSLLSAAGADVLSDPVTVPGPDGRRTLQAVPQPDLSGTEQAVGQALEDARAQVAALVSRGGVSDDALAAAYGELGRLYHAHHLYAAAAACYLNAELMTPQAYEWPYYLGYVYQQASQPDKAAQAYERALQILPGDGLTQLRLGQVQLELNDPERAQPLFEAVMQVEGLQTAALFGLGKVALSRREYEQAAKLFKQAIEQQPKATRIHYALAMAYRGLGDINEAKFHLAKRGEGEPRIQDPLVDELGILLSGARTQLFRGIEAVRDGHYEIAVEAFTEALELEPENVNARVSLARSLYLAGNRTDARKQLEAALQSDPNHDLANFLMGVFADELGSVELATTHYRATLTADPEHAGAHYYLANILMRGKQYPQAAHHYAKALEGEPNNYVARSMGALALIRSAKQDVEARRWLEEGLRRHPEERKIRLVLARLLAASADDSVRDGDRALVLAQTLFDEFHSLENAETLAMAYAEVGRFEDAAALQKNAIEATSGAGRIFLLPRLNENLTLYERGQPCRAPWLAQDPIITPPPTSGWGPFYDYPTLHAY